MVVLVAGDGFQQQFECDGAREVEVCGWVLMRVVERL
jgi:hypothetical protein